MWVCVSSVFLTFSSLWLHSTPRPWRWVCDLPTPTPFIFAIIPRIWAYYRTRPNTSAPNQGQAPFWFHANARNADQRKQNGWRLLLLAQNEGQVLHSLQPPKCDKTSYWNAYMTRFKFFAVPRPPPPKAKKKWSKFTSCTFLLLLYGARCAENVSAFVTSNTGECAYALWAKKNSTLSYFTYCHRYCVTKVGEHRTQNLPFTWWPLYWIM